MLLSMTGFGKGVAHSTGKQFTVELKSLNSKQFDINTRIPSSLRSLDLDMRAAVGRRLERGKVDLIVSVESPSATAATLNADVLKAYKAQIDSAALTLGIQAPADYWQLLLRMPDVYATDSTPTLSDVDIAAVYDALNQATDALMAHRRAEGERLEAFFALRIAKITELLAEVPKYETQRIDRIKARLADGLSKIPNVDYDKARLEQEMIFYIEKLDVNEEKQRLAQHLRYFTETMALPEPGQGKKLGFITQEMGREINTLGSKSNDADMQRLVVMMKDELEQIKEQVLNVM